MAEESTPTELTEEDFDLAFEAVASGEETTETLPEGDTPPDDKPSGSDDKPEDAPPKGDGEESEDDPPKGDGEESDAGEVPPTKESPEDLAKAAAVAVAAAAKVKTDEANATAKAKADAKSKAAEAAAREALTDDEQTSLDQIQVDFPEVAKAMEAKERTLLAKIDNVFDAKMEAFLEQINKRIAPTEAAVVTTANNAHEAAILKGHADAFEIIPAVEKWIAEQPAFIQPSYNNVLDNGSSAEIVELFTFFKESTGTGQDGPTAEEAAAKKAEEKAKEKKLNSQEGVRSRRTETTNAVDPEDFDGAFDKYAD